MSLDPTPFTFRGAGGIQLRGDRRGRADAPPVVFLHGGGGGPGFSWGGTATAVAERGWQAVTLDARGHGESDWAADANYRLSSFAQDLDAALAVPANPVVIGASLGGLTSILLAGELHPGVLAGLVLVDIVPDMEARGADRIQGIHVGERG